MRRLSAAAGWVVVAAMMVPATLTAQDPESKGSYRLAPGDVVNIIVWRSPELTMPVTVRPDGWIALPLVDELRVEGMTAGELRARLESVLAKSLASPQVTVVLATSAGFKVSILGRVRQPGRFDVEASTTVLDVLAMAGGPNDYADASAMYVLRRKGPGDGAYDRIPMRYSSRMNAGDGDINITVKPGDIVIVP